MYATVLSHCPPTPPPPPNHNHHIVFPFFCLSCFTCFDTFFFLGRLSVMLNYYICFLFRLSFFFFSFLTLTDWSLCWKAFCSCEETCFPSCDNRERGLSESSCSCSRSVVYFISTHVLPLDLSVHISSLLNVLIPGKWLSHWVCVLLFFLKLSQTAAFWSTRRCLVKRWKKQVNQQWLFWATVLRHMHCFYTSGPYSASSQYKNSSWKATENWTL